MPPHAASTHGTALLHGHHLCGRLLCPVAVVVSPLLIHMANASSPPSPNHSPSVSVVVLIFVHRYRHLPLTPPMHCYLIVVFVILVVHRPSSIIHRPLSIFFCQSLAIRTLLKKLPTHVHSESVFVHPHFESSESCEIENIQRNRVTNNTPPWCSRVTLSDASQGVTLTATHSKVLYVWYFSLLQIQISTNSRRFPHPVERI